MSNIQIDSQLELSYLMDTIPSTDG
jgi:hypothetical protein